MSGIRVDNLDTITSSDSFALDQVIPRTQVHMNTQDNESQRIYSSANLSSFTDGGVGILTLTMSTNFDAADYMCQVGAYPSFINGNRDDRASWRGRPTDYTYSTSACQVYCWYFNESTNFGAMDQLHDQFQLFGNHV